MITACLFSFNNLKAQDLIISGVFDGQPSWASNPDFPKGVEIYVAANIGDLSVYGLSSANNGNGTTSSPEFVFPAVAATAGSYIYIVSDSSAFNDFFGFDADYVDGAANINGDDAIELFMNGSVIDVFGDVNVDGTGETWEYTDGWAYRNNGTGPDAATFTEANWSISAIDDLQGATDNASSTNPFPIGTFQLVATPTMNLETSSFTMNEGDAMTIVTRLVIDPAATTNGSYEIHLVGGNGSAADLDLTLFGGGPFPLTLPYQAGNDTLTVPITPNDDAVYEGTETFEFVLRNPTGGLVLGADTTFTLTMTDNELPPDTTVNFNPVAVTANEGNGTVDLTIEVGQLSVNGTTFTVDVDLATGDAADLDNYTTQTVSFTPTGTVTQTLTVNITDDALVEGTETSTFTLSNPSTGLTLGTNTTATLTLTDNDAPTYTIADLTTVDATGNPDSLGVAVELDVVVMGINYGDAPNVNFYIHDGTGGMGVFSSNNFGYTVNEGDNITIRGTVEFYNGLTQIGSVDTIFTTTSTNPLPAVTTVTSLGETEEGELVKLENVTVLDQSDWGNGTATGFNVDVTDGTDTFSVRIDKSADLFNMTIPGCVIDVTGIGSQFDATSPYTSGYQLLPRYAADITVITACPTVAPPTIGDATATNPQGDPLMLGTTTVLRGIITSPDFREGQDGTEFTFADNTGGIWAYSSDSTISFNPIVGDSVVVYGEIGASNGATRFYIDSVAALGAATPFTPTVVTTALAESEEAELITLENLTLTGAWDISGGSFNVSASGNGTTYDIRVDANRSELFTQIIENGDLFNITGVGAQFDASSPRDEGYQIMPRFITDIEFISSIKELELNNFTVSPVPATDVLNISFDFDNNEEAMIQLVNVIGKVVAQQNTSLIKGTNTNTINVANLNAGFYVLQVKTSNGVSNTNVLVK